MFLWNAFYFSAFNSRCGLHLTDGIALTHVGRRVPLFRPGSSALVTHGVRQRGPRRCSAPPGPPKASAAAAQPLPGGSGPPEPFGPAPRRTGRAGPPLGRTNSPAPGRARRSRLSDLRSGRGRPRAAAGGSVAAFRRRCRRRLLAALRRRARTGARDGQLRRRSTAGRGPGRASACSRRSRAVVPRKGQAPPDATPRRRQAAAQVPGGRRRAVSARGAGPTRLVRPFGPGGGARRGRAVPSGPRGTLGERPGPAVLAALRPRVARRRPRRAVRGEAAAGGSRVLGTFPGRLLAVRAGHGASRGRQRAPC